MKEVRYCSIAVKQPNDTKSTINYIYRVESIKLKARKAITKEQAGSEPKNNNLYWLLELSNAHQLPNPIILTKVRGFSFQLTGERDLLRATHWNDLPSRYHFLQEKAGY